MAGGSELAEFVTCFGDIKRFPDPVAGGIDSDTDDTKAMSWVTVIWSMSAGACLTLAFLQFIVWCKDRAARANLVFALGAVAVAVFAGMELALMRAETPAQFGTVARWIHVPAWVLIVSIVAFVRLYLNAGRRWLAWTVVAVRTLALILNFVLSPNINYRKLTALRHMPFLGEPVSVPIGVPNPWMLVAQFSLLLLVIFVVDATITVWRRGNRRQALVVGGSIVLLVVLASAQAVAMTWGFIATPLTVSLFYLILVAAMAYELSYDLIRTAQVTRRLQASEAILRESEQRFRTVADAAPVLIWMSGVDKLCTFFNKRWFEFTGRSPEQEMGNGWADGVHPEDLDRCFDIYTEAFDARKPFVMQYRLRRNDGDYRWISDNGVPRYDADGTFAGYIGSCIDISGRKASELEAQRHRAELAHLSRVALMGEMSASLAHELNQPLTGIISNSAAGRRLIDAARATLPEVRELLMDINADGRRASEVVRGIRSMVKKGEPTRQPMNVNDVVTSVVKIVHADAVLRACQVQTSLEADLPPIDGDFVQLQQVLLNLVLNGFDAMSDTPVDLRKVMIATESNGDRTIHVSVRDHGSGIPEPFRERLFAPFFTTKTEGLGMGLAIVRSIIESHGGVIEAENATGGGALFHFTLSAHTPVIA